MENSVNNANKFYFTFWFNFISHSESDFNFRFWKTRTMYTNSRNIEIMEGNETDEIIKELFESLLQNYQKNLEEPMRGSKFVPDGNDL